MFGLLRWLLLFSVLVSGAAVAASAPPDPVRLAADWWGYFEPAEKLDAEALQKRVSDTREQLEQLKDELSPAQRAELLPRIARLQEHLSLYANEREQKVRHVPALAPPLESYTLEQAFAANETLIQLRADLNSRLDESTWQTDLLKAERKQQSRKKVAYLEMSPTDAERLKAGLDLMLTRVQIERETLELERRKVQIDELQGQQATLQEEVDQLASRLVLSEEDLPQWQKLEQSAQAELAVLQNDEVVSANLLNGEAATQADPTGSLALRLLLRDIRSKKAELTAARAATVSALLGFASSQGADASAVRAAVSEAKELIEGLAPRQNYWDNAVSRLQNAAGRDESGDSKTAAKAREQAQQLIVLIQQANAAIDLESKQLAFASRLVGLRLRSEDSAVSRGWAETVELAGKVFEATGELFSASLIEINETPVTLFGLLRVVIFITLAWLLSKAVQRGLERLAARRATVSQSSLYTLGRISHYVILAFGVIVGLSSIGIDFTKFALLASALGIGIGFGMQALVSNFVAGLIILFEKSLKVGDFVELESGVTGEVKEINMRATLLTTNDNVDILVPNSEFINKEVTNWTLREAHRRIHVPFGVAYGTSKELVEKAVLEAADAVRWTLKDNKRRAPQVWFVNFGDSSLDFELIVWLIPEAVKRPGAVQAGYLWEIDTKLREYDIEVPFPQRDLHLRSGFDNAQTAVDSTPQAAG